MKSKNEGLNPSTLRKVLRKAKRTMICQQHSTVLICCGPVLVQVSPDFYRAHLADLYPVTLHEGAGYDLKPGEAPACITPDTLQSIADKNLHAAADPAHDTGKRLTVLNGEMQVWATDTGRFALLPAEQLKIMTGKGWKASLHGPVNPVCFYNMEQGTALHVCPVRVNNETFKQLYEQYGGCNNG